MVEQTADRCARATPDWRSGTVGFGLCIAAGTLSILGDTMQGFALNWEATAFGADVAGLVATLGVLPRALLMLLGGAVADRHGIRRVMIIGDVLMAVAVAGALTVLTGWQPTLAVIIGLTLVGSAISAFYTPAAGGFVRLFVPDARLPTVLPRISGVQQLARMIGPALGAIVVVAVGLSGALTLNLITFLIIIVALIIVRPPRESILRGEVDFESGSAVGQLLAGARLAWRTPGMVAALMSLALLATGVLPVLYLGVPLLAREIGWGAPAAGWIESAWIVGTLTVTLIMARYGTHRRIGWMIMVGAVVAASGAAMIAVAPVVPIAVGGSVLMGLGTAIFTGHLSPLYLSWTPPQMTARLQALFGIAQSVPLVLANASYGLLGATIGARAALAAAATMSLAAAGVVVSSNRLRSSTTLGEGSQPRT